MSDQNDLFAPPTPEELAAVKGIGQGSAAMRGTAKGVTFGLSPFVAGSVGAAGDAVKKMSVSDIVKDYIANRDEYKANDDLAEKAYPKTYGAGVLAGGFATAAVPGLNIAKIGSTGGRIGAAGLMGAASGFGNSNADLTKGEFGKAAFDTGVGTVTGGLMQPAIERVAAPAIGYAAQKAAPIASYLSEKAAPVTEAISNAAGPVLQKAGQVAGSIGKKALNVVTGVSEGVQSRYLDHPEAINNASSEGELGQKLANTLGQVRSDTGVLSNAAKQTLSSDRKAVPGFEISNAVDKLKKFNDPDAQKLAQKLESDYAGRIGTVSPEANPEYLNQDEMHQVKQTLQGLTDFRKPLPTADQAAARSASGK